MKAHPSDLPQGTCSLPRAEPVGALRDQTPVVKGGDSLLSPGRAVLGSWVIAGTDCILHLLTPLSLSAQAVPTSPHDGVDVLPQLPPHKLFHRTRLVTKPKKTPNPGE